MRKSYLTVIIEQFVALNFGTQFAVYIFYERQKEVSGGVSVWDFLFLIPDKEILIKTYPSPYSLVITNGWGGIS